MLGGESIPDLPRGAELLCFPAMGPLGKDLGVLGKKPVMSNKPEEAAVLIMKAAADIREAAALDRKRRTELSCVADYLESIIYEAELGYGEPLFPEPPPGALPTPEEEVRQMIKPFRVRLSR